MKILALVLVLFMQHDQMPMPGMQMKKPPVKKQQKKKPAPQHHEPMNMPGMERQHDMPGMSMPSMPSMPEHHVEANPNIKVITAAPRSSSAIAAIRPSATLKADELDAPKGSQ